jgi:hypothetical protein
VAVCDQFLKGLGKLDPEEDGDAEESHTLDIQRNHTSSTANRVYGGTSGLRVDRDSELRFMIASERWQEFWKVIFPYTHIPISI